MRYVVGKQYYLLDKQLTCIYVDHDDSHWIAGDGDHASIAIRESILMHNIYYHVLTMTIILFLDP